MTDTAEPEVRTAGEPLLDLLNGFIVELREAGLPVSLTENLDAMAAIEHIPLEERETFKYALAATLVKNNAHWRSFETVFEVYFSLRGAKYGIDDDSLDPELADLLDDDENQGEGDALEIVARAMLELEGPEPEGFRVAGFLREDALVVHGSLRRWDRLHGEDDRVEDRIVDAPFANRRTIDLG